MGSPGPDRGQVGGTPVILFLCWPCSRREGSSSCDTSSGEPASATAWPSWDKVQVFDESDAAAMKRIAILTAGGDTPALNATIHGAVVRANQLRIEIYGLIKGFNCLFNPRVPHVHLNPLFQEIPELDPTKGGTLIGSSRDYIDPDQGARARSHHRPAEEAGHRGADRRRRRRHAQRTAAAGRAPADGPRAEDHRQRPRPELSERGGRMDARRRAPTAQRLLATRTRRRARPSISNQIVNYATPGYATAVWSPRRAWSASARRPRATAASRSSR